MERLAQIAAGSRPCLGEKKGRESEVRSAFFFERRFASVEARTSLGGMVRAAGWLLRDEPAANADRRHLIIITRAPSNPSPATQVNSAVRSNSLERLRERDQDPAKSSRCLQICGEFTTGELGVPLQATGLDGGCFRPHSMKHLCGRNRANLSILTVPCMP